PIELKILPSPGDSAESFFHSLMAASNWPREAKICALCKTLLRSIAKSNLHNDQTLTVSLSIVNELGLCGCRETRQKYEGLPPGNRAGLPMHFRANESVRIRQWPSSRRSRPEAPWRLARPRTQHFLLLLRS